MDKLKAEVEKIISEMTDHLDQDVEPDFDVIEQWRDYLREAVRSQS